MAAPIALQLYTLRDALAVNFDKVIQQVTEIGYVGVEPAGFPGTTLEAASRLFERLGLAVPSAHLPLPVGERASETINTALALGCTHIVSGLGPNQFKTVDQIREACDLFNQASTAAAANGLSFGIHNHWWEFEQIEGRYIYQVMLEHLDQAVCFEIDTYWVKTAGLDPAAVVAELGSRAPLLHIKDGPCIQNEPMVAAGHGVMDIPSIVAAGQASTKWLIVELDRCATDMMTAVAQSYEYLVTGGLARGNKS